MTGFTDLSRVEPETKGKAETKFVIADLSSEDIWLHVRRGRQIRSAHLAAWGREVLETWKSLFRRPGSPLPASARRASV